MKRIVLFVLLGLLLSNCAVNAKSQKSKIPEWLQNPKKVYPDQLYLTAIGEGDTRADAENMATANLSKIFQSKVHSEENVNQRYMELTKSGKTDVSDFTSVNKNVNIKSEQELFNIQFAQSYTDKNGIVHVLAYINRVQTSEIYQQKIENNSKKIKYLIDKSKTDDVLKKYAYLSAAMVIAKKNRVLIDQLTIIDNSALDLLNTDYSINDLSLMLSKAAMEVNFTLSIKDESSRIAPIIEAVLTDMGFILGENGVLKISGEVNFKETDLKRNDGFKFVRYNLHITVSDNNNNVIVALNEKGREGHLSVQEAKERCIRKLEKKIKKNLKRKLIKYFDGLAIK